MKLEDVTRGQAVILPRRAICGNAPERSCGFGENIIAEVFAICNGTRKGLVRVRFRNPFNIGDHGHPLTEEMPIDPALLEPATTETVKRIAAA